MGPYTTNDYVLIILHIKRICYIVRVNSNSDDWKLDYMIIISIDLNTSEDGSLMLDKQA